MADITGDMVAVTEGGSGDTKFRELSEGEVATEGGEDTMDTIIGERGLTLTTDVDELLEECGR